MDCCVKVERMVDEVDDSLRFPEKSELGCSQVSAFSQCKAAILPPSLPGK